MGNRAASEAAGRSTQATATAVQAAASSAPGASSRATFTQVFAVGEFRALWLAMLLSVAGDQLARVAMTVLVYDRTRSAFLTALTYAMTLLPWLVGGVALSGLADRLPRRQVMIACDVARLVLVLGMVVVSLGRSAAALWAMVALLFGVTLLDSPFKSARSALVADILTGERYVLGTTVTQLTFQAGMVLGFALGGVAVAAVGTRGALGVDAATFAASALLLTLWVQPAWPRRGHRTERRYRHGHRGRAGGPVGGPHDARGRPNARELGPFGTHGDPPSQSSHAGQRSQDEAVPFLTVVFPVCHHSELAQHR